MPMVLRMVIDCRCCLGRVPDGHVLHSKARNKKVAAPGADEWAGDGRDVALRAPLLHEEIPVRTLKPQPRPSGRSRKSSNGHATSHTETVSCASTASTARGYPIGRALMVQGGGSRRDAATSPADHPGARPLFGGPRRGASSPALNSAQAMSEFEFHMSVVPKA